LPCVAGIALTACFAPTVGAEDDGPGTQPPNELFGADAGSNPACPGGDTSPLSQLHIRVRTTAVGGRYAPRNVGAIWIESGTGTFIKTVERWGSTRARYLTRFTAASGGNVVDAITSATLAQHTTHDREWNLKDRSECEIAAGDYRVVIEHTDRNSTGVSIVLPFSKDQSAVTLMPAEATNFHDLVLELR
jgi:hypothetical protein